MIHFVAKFVGYAAGTVIVILAGRYGFMTSDDIVTGSIAAFAFGLVAFAGTFGPMIALRVARTSKLIAAPILLTAIAALAGNIVVDVQAMRSRGEEQTAQRTSVANTVSDARRNLTVAETESAGLKFTPADGAAVTAAKARADAATLDKEAARRDYDTAKQASDTECLVRGKVCLEKEKLTAEKERLWHEKERAEGEALAALRDAIQSKALTDRAAKLDAQIAAYRAEIKSAGPVRETDGPGKVLADLFGQPEAEAAKLVTWQTFVMMTVAELFIMALLLGAEEIERQEKRSAPVPVSISRPVARREDEEGEPAALIGHEEIALPDAPETACTVEPFRETRRPRPAPARAIESFVQTGAPRVHATTRMAAEAANGPQAQHSFPVPAKPRLVSSETGPAGSVVQFVREVLEPGTARNKVSVIELYKAYAADCVAAGKRPINPAEFPVALAPICEACGIAIRDDGAAGIFLLKTKLNRRVKEAMAD
jgi:hypothetical protein